jgi:hypothetical protein
MNKTDPEVTGNRLDPGMEKGMCHCRIEQGTDYTTVQDSVVPLQSSAELNLRPHRAFPVRFET